MNIGVLLDSRFLFLGSVSILRLVACRFPYCGFVTRFEVTQSHDSSLVLSAKDCSLSFALPYAAHGVCSPSRKDADDTLMAIARNLYNAFGRVCIFTKSILPFQERGLSCYFFGSSSTSFDKENKHHTQRMVFVLLLEKMPMIL